MNACAIGQSERDRIEVEVLGYERPRSGDYHDDNWLHVLVSVTAGAFAGAFNAAFLTEELVVFRGELARLYQSLSGEATFSTLEEQLHLRVSGNGRGEIRVVGSATDMAGTGNRLEFHFELDQTHLASSFSGLNEVIDTYPIRVG